MVGGGVWCGWVKCLVGKTSCWNGGKTILIAIDLSSDEDDDDGS